MSRATFYITTPIYYPNDRLHVGHTYTTVAADALARYHRLLGDDTWFLTGTDEHGQKLERVAREAGREPLAYIDPIVAATRELWQALHISYDDFIRTTEPRHKERVQAIFQALYDAGEIYLGTYRGRYCTDCETYLGTDELLEGELCPVHERPVDWLEEESYFFRLSKYAGALLEHIEAHPEFVQPETRRNEVTSFIRQGLEDLSVSRTSLDWGIPVPFNNRHVIYVWIDALSNYVSALGYPDGERYRRYWPADVHIIGKDILRFHAVIWPAMLMALGEPLPRRVFGHGWLLIGGGKIGKSAGNIVDPLQLIAKYGVDPVRYYLLREVPFGADGNYSEAALIRRTNVDLANDLGNLLWRTLSMLERFADGVIPRPEPEADDGVLSELAVEVVTEVTECLDDLRLSDAVEAALKLILRANKYVDERAPWELNRQGDAAGLNTVLYNVAEALRLTGALLAPFLVEAPRAIWQQLGLEQMPEELGWDQAVTWGQLPPGSGVAKAEPLFPRIDAEEALAGDGSDGAEEVDEAGARPGASEPAAEPEAGAESGERVSFETFSRLDLRVAEVTAAERIEGSDRLLRLDVRLGEATRQLVAGIAGSYTPEELVGRSVIVVANLEPATIFGVRSEGMVLAAEHDGQLSLLTADPALPPGSRVR